MSANEYASWSVALKYMVLYRNEVKFDDIKIGKSPDGIDLTFGKWYDIPENYFVKHKDNFKEFKKVDLGGGDQEKIRNGDIETVKKYEKKAGVLCTGGNDEARLKNSKELFQNAATVAAYKNYLNLKIAETPPPPKLNALSINMETALTAAAYYDKAKELLEDATYDEVYLIPIGSTDLHVIKYKKDNDGEVLVEQENLPNYKDDDNKKTIELNDAITEKTLLVFAGSARFYLNDIINKYDAFLDTAAAYCKHFKSEKPIDHADNARKKFNLKHFKSTVTLNDTDMIDKNDKIIDFIKCMKKIQFGTNDNVAVDIIAGGDQEGNVTKEALRKCLEPIISQQGGKRRRRSRRNRKGKRSTKKARKQSRKQKNSRRSKR